MIIFRLASDESRRLILPRLRKVINPSEVRIHFEDNGESFPENYPSKEGSPKIVYAGSKIGFQKGRCVLSQLVEHSI